MCLIIQVSECVICNGPIRKLKNALVAPFLATRIWNRSPFLLTLVACDRCEFKFYNPRFDDEELQRLYVGYRSDDYQKMRHASEIWYTPKFNHDLASPESYASRRARLASILQHHIGKRRIDCILDHGGDRGDLVAGLFDGAEAFVYDISGVTPATGVIATNDPAGCGADLIINSNVLEHVGFPRQVVSEVIAAAPQGGLIYLEVPCENPFGTVRMARRIAQIAVMSVTRPALIKSIIHPASLYMMHEHINYFTEACLSTLLRACGANLIASGAYGSSGRAGNAILVWCLGSKERAAEPATENKIVRASK